MVIVTSVVARVAANVLGGASFALGMILMDKANDIRTAKKKKAESLWNRITTSRR